MMRLAIRSTLLDISEAARRGQVYPSMPAKPDVTVIRIVEKIEAVQKVEAGVQEHLLWGVPQVDFIWRHRRSVADSEAIEREGALLSRDCNGDLIS